MYTKHNYRENKIIRRFTKQGYEVLTKGWPDLLCYKGGKVVLVEVKRKQKRPSSKMGLSKHQRRVHEILKEIGFEVVVEYVT